MIAALLSALMRRSLRRTFRRVVWAGPPLDVEPGRPIVLYANHQYHHDAYLLWLLLRSMDRAALTWMQEWDRYPFFAAVGALPFPDRDTARRARTVRTTAARFRRRPDSGLIWFPEGRLHGSDEPLLPFPTQGPERMHAILGRPQWAAVGIRVVWAEEARPTAFLGGDMTAAPDGNEADRLARAVNSLPADPHAAGHLLLEGVRGVEERFQMQALRPLFSRYL